MKIIFKGKMLQAKLGRYIVPGNTYIHTYI